MARARYHGGVSAGEPKLSIPRWVPPAAREALAAIWEQYPATWQPDQFGRNPVLDLALLERLANHEVMKTEVWA
jgi:hypothetical protein